MAEQHKEYRVVYTCDDNGFASHDPWIVESVLDPKYAQELVKQTTEELKQIYNVFEVWIEYRWISDWEKFQVVS